LTLELIAFLNRIGRDCSNPAGSGCGAVGRSEAAL
jgi:hypothetical protein